MTSSVKKPSKFKCKYRGEKILQIDILRRTHQRLSHINDYIPKIWTRANMKWRNDSLKKRKGNVKIWLTFTNYALYKFICIWLIVTNKNLHNNNIMLKCIYTRIRFILLLLGHPTTNIYIHLGWLHSRFIERLVTWSDGEDHSYSLLQLFMSVNYK